MIVASELSLVISNILCRVLTCVSIQIGRLTHVTVVKRGIDSGFRPLNLASSVQKHSPYHPCICWFTYATICDNSDCSGSTLLFFFVEPIHGQSTHGIQFFFFFKFWKNVILIWNKSVFFKKFIFKLFFFSFFIIFFKNSSNISSKFSQNSVQNSSIFDEIYCKCLKIEFEIYKIFKLNFLIISPKFSEMFLKRFQNFLVFFSNIHTNFTWDYINISTNTRSGY